MVILNEMKYGHVKNLEKNTAQTSKRDDLTE